MRKVLPHSGGRMPVIHHRESHMGLFSRLFGSRKPVGAATVGTTRTTTVRNPFRIDVPTIGFVNLRGGAGEETTKADQEVLQSLFTEVRESRSEIPRCA